MYTKKLEEAGIPRVHAEAQVQMMAEVIEEDVASKQDLKELEYRLVIKLGAIATIAVATVATILTTFIKFF